MVQANRNRPLVPAFGVTLNGETITKAMAPWVASIKINDQINLPGMFELQLVGRDARDRAPQWVDDPRLRLGARIELSLGYDAQLDTMIVGEITDLEPAFSVGGPPQLIVRGQDRRYLLNGAPRTQNFVKLKDSEIAGKLLQKIASPEMTIEVTDSAGERNRSQNQQTDLAFLQKLAELIGYETVMKGTKLLFRPTANHAAAVATLTFDDDLIEFRPHKTLLPVTSVRGIGWDRQKKGTITAPVDSVRAMDGTLGTKQIETIVQNKVEMPLPASVLTQEDLDQQVTAEFNRIALRYIQCDGRCRGRTDVRAGTVIRIDKIGSSFSGPYYVTSAAHSYTPGDGYITSFQMQRNAS